MKVRFVKLDNEVQRCCHLYILGYGGGLVSGDTSTIRVNVRPSARLCLRTQGSTKIFRGVDGKSCTQAMDALVEKDGLVGPPYVRI